MKRKNIGIFTGVLLSAFAALNLNAAAIKAGTSAPKMKPVLTVEYEYSRSGQIIGRKINGRKQSYKYDKKGQLLGVYDEKGNAVEEYVYDPAGNILKKTIHGRTTTYKYDKANQLVSSECNKKVTKYEYDAAGRLVKEGDKVYSYIGLDKIESVTEGGRKLSSFTYHIDGQLAARVSIESSETFHWDGLALIQRNSTSYVNEPAVTGGNPILADDKILFNDMLGTTLGVKDGDKVTQNNLTAFGESLSASPMQDSFFTGKPHVGELGYAFLFRNYRADQGKWQTADPLGYPDGWNNLAYVNNKVLCNIDYLGFWAQGIEYSSRTQDQGLTLLTRTLYFSTGNTPFSLFLISKVIEDTASTDNIGVTIPEYIIEKIKKDTALSVLNEKMRKRMANIEFGETLTFNKTPFCDAVLDDDIDVASSIHGVTFYLTGSITKTENWSGNLTVIIDDPYDFNASSSNPAIAALGRLYNHNWLTKFNVKGSFQYTFSE